MREATHTDELGRRWLVLLPDGVPDGDAAMGIPAGPPSLDSLGLPEEVQTRLHNQLFDRRLFRRQDVRRRRHDLVGALQAALRVDAGKIIELYMDDRGG